MTGDGDGDEGEWEIAPLVDNDKVMMREQLRNIVGSASEIKIAVGFFFVSGLDGLMDKLGGVDRIQVIMGRKTDPSTKGALGAGHSAKSRVEGGYAREDVMRDVVAHLESVESEDALRRLDAVVGLIVEGKLEVRVYVKDRGYFHPKGYWFNCRGTLHTDVAVVGSHNMSSSAQTDNDELSFVSKEKWHTEALREWFERKWREASPFDEDLLTLIHFSRGYRKYKRRERERERGEAGDLPYEYLPPVEFLKAVISRLGKGYLLDTDDLLIHFQKIDYNLCRDTLRRFGGVILANTVGLGKSFIAARLAKDYAKEGREALFIVPVNTMLQWEEYLDLFGLEVERGRNLISKGVVSRADFPEREYARFDVIVVDESHKFRNRGSNRWQNFMERIKNPGADYILLTATPINNKMEDLYSQVRMFENERFRNEDLIDLYKDLEEYVMGGEEDETLLPSIRALRRKVIVRTTRRDLKRLYDEVVIPGRGRVEIVDPEVRQCFYTLSGPEYEELFSAFIDDFIMPLRLPQVGIRNPSAARSLHGLYKILLYKRMESSVYSLHRSVEALEAKLRNLRRVVSTVPLDEIRGLDKADYRRLLAAEDELDPEISDAEESGGESAGEEGRTAEEYLADIEHDLGLVTAFRGLLEDTRIGEFKYLDDKMEALLALLRENPGKKTLVFTQFTDTARYLRENLRGEAVEGRLVRMVTGGSGRKMLEAVKFSPSSYGEETKRKLEAEHGVAVSPPYTDVLVSTDALSEGVNLQEADLVVNYDLPWNPVRLIQRVGRANRIGSSGGLTAVNFLPDEKIDQEMRLLERLRSKIHNIIQIINSEHSILSPDEMALIERREADDLDLLERKRRLMRELDLDGLEPEGERGKLSALDRYLMRAADLAGIRQGSLGEGELPEAIPYTVMEGYPPARLYLYELGVGRTSYPGYAVEGVPGTEIPLPSSLRSPRQRLTKADLEAVDTFVETDLRELEMRRRRAQRVVFDVASERAKMKLVARLRSVRRATSARLRGRDGELHGELSAAIPRLERLRVPRRRKGDIRAFLSRWFGDEGYLEMHRVFLEELRELLGDLETASEVVDSAASVSSDLAGFAIYDPGD
jgi:superfamily II DNA or RNA helicase/HKD family nuclease